MAAELKKKYRVNAKLIKSGGGVFEVTVDGDLIFSKKNLGRFPETAEIFKEIDARKTAR